MSSTAFAINEFMQKTTDRNIKLINNCVSHSYKNNYNTFLTALMWIMVLLLNDLIIIISHTTFDVFLVFFSHVCLLDGSILEICKEDGSVVVVLVKIYKNLLES